MEPQNEDLSPRIAEFNAAKKKKHWPVFVRKTLDETFVGAFVMPRGSYLFNIIDIFDGGDCAELRTAYLGYIELQHLLEKVSRQFGLFCSARIQV